MTCNQGHGEISYRDGKCPLCQVLADNRKMRQSVENMQFNVLVNEVEMLFDFSTGEERKMFYHRGQA